MQQNLSHIVLQNLAQRMPYTSPRIVFSESQRPSRNRPEHGNSILSQIEQAFNTSAQEENALKAKTKQVRDGTYLSISGSPGFELIDQSLEAIRSGIKLLNVVETVLPDGKAVETATIFVPREKEAIIKNKIKRYLDENTKTGKPKNQAFIESIESIQTAPLQFFWMDDLKLLPKTQAQWCEVWLSSEKDEDYMSFETLLKTLGIKISDVKLRFPERLVTLISANEEQLNSIIISEKNLAEFRGIKSASAYFTDLNRFGQMEWIENLLSRLKVNKDSKVSVCLLDTGVNNGHPLLAPIIEDRDLHSYDDSWGVQDDWGHGTEMCGLAAFGVLENALVSGNTFQVNHRIESSKIIRSKNDNNPKLFGYITAQALMKSEIERPAIKRISCLAVTTDPGLTPGRPSSWSAEIDSLTSGQNEEGETHRLFCISAGNVTDTKLYPAINLVTSIQDPGQSWNAVTVGAYTDKIDLKSPLPGYKTIANKGDLSPISVTSYAWDKMWPNKPDIVMEGGNWLKDHTGFCTEHDDLMLLTTHHKVTEKLFTVFSGTSASTALVSEMAAKIQSAYPDMWPETVRALLVHSAEWTEAMKARFLSATPNREQFNNLLRVFGYGVPDLKAAVESASNSLTLIAEEKIQPFDKLESGYITKEMHLYEIPWPREALLDLSETEAEMRITLSYYIEANPGQKGWQNKYQYQSHGLRFEVNNSTEKRDNFIMRVNKAARDEESGKYPNDSSRWLLGERNRSRGSIHSDTWKCTGAELATSNLVAVYPVSGWWKERPQLGRWNRSARYSLVVTIKTPNQEVDLYTPVKIMVEAQPIQISVK